MTPSELAPTLHRLADFLALLRRMAGDAKAEAVNLCTAAERNDTSGRQSLLSRNLLRAVETLGDLADGSACPDAGEELRSIAEHLVTETATRRASDITPAAAPESLHISTEVNELAPKEAIHITMDRQMEPTNLLKSAAKHRRRRDAKEPSDEARSEKPIVAATPHGQRRKCIDPNCTWIGWLPGNAKCPTCGKSTIRMR